MGLPQVEEETKRENPPPEMGELAGVAPSEFF